MGLNATGGGMQQPMMNPQAASDLSQIQTLQRIASTPGQGGPGAGASQGVSQLTAALLGRQKMTDWQKKWGIQTPATIPGQNPNAGAVPIGNQQTPGLPAP